MADSARKPVPFIQNLISNYIGSYRTVIALTLLSSSCSLTGSIAHYLKKKAEAEMTIAESQYCKPVIDDVIGENIPELYCDMGEQRYYFSIDGKSIEELHPTKTILDKLTNGCQ